MSIRTALPFVVVAALVVCIVLAIVAIPETQIPNLAAVSTSEVVSLTNDERSGQGITALQRNSLLDRAAQMKAEDMATKGYYAHVSPEGITPMYWVEQAGYQYLIVGENLVVNRSSADQVVSAFMGSPGHRANILRKDFTEIGVGVAKGTYKGKDAVFTVQIFAAPYPQKVAVKKEEPKFTPAPAPKPKPPVATTPKPVVPAVVVPEPAAELVKEVQKLVEPLIPEVATTSTATSTNSMATSTDTQTPTAFLIDVTSPIELTGVPQVEAETSSTPLGYTWNMRFRAWLDEFASAIGSFF